VDIILFSGTFEGGGNGDGRGPDQFASSPTPWRPASCGSTPPATSAAASTTVRLKCSPAAFLRLGGDADATALRFRSLLDENTIAVTLTWNDYREQEDAGTDKDLDLYVEDWQGQRVGSSEKTQVPAGKAPGPQETRNPRERIILTDLPASADQDYRIRIRVKKGKFHRCPTRFACCLRRNERRTSIRKPSARLPLCVSSTREAKASSFPPPTIRWS